MPTIASPATLALAALGPHDAHECRGPGRPVSSRQAQHERGDRDAVGLAAGSSPRPPDRAPPPRRAVGVRGLLAVRVVAVRVAHGEQPRASRGDSCRPDWHDVVVRHIDDHERQARLARRQGLTGGLPDVVSATRAMTVLHATEAATVHLALWARVPGVSLADVDAALYDDRALVKQLAMRRTLFVFPRDLLPAAWGSAAARVAVQQRKQLAKWVVEAGLAEDADAWIDRGVRRRARRDGRRGAPHHARAPRPGAGARGTLHARHAGEEVGRRVPDRRVGDDHPRCRGPGAARHERRSLAAQQAHLGARRPLAGRRPGAAWPEDKGYAELVRRWLATFGPGTETDIVWWLGATKTIVRRALADIGAVEVGLDGRAGAPAGCCPTTSSRRSRSRPGRRCSRPSTRP